ncbi:DUF6171 family protein [Leadbettera azotonutricia]|uniref:DUF6171 family protein n=1 Tax=Leadbettera azotonutricia TaxID=150829 RepID=UPI003CCA9C06
MRLAIASPLAVSLRSDSNRYAQRLQCCIICESLKEGVLCAHCGCFIQFRALSNINYCPHPKGDKWKDEGVL